MQQQDNNKDNFRDLIQGAKVICVIGGPCSGKKVAAQMIQEEYGFTYISTGDVLRKEMLKGTKEGDRVRKLMQDGAIIPYETVVHCLLQEMVLNKSQNFVIDGFPRSIDQAQYFEQSLGEIQQVIYLKASYNMLFERLENRCKNPPGGVKRLDDNVEVIKKRMNAYNDQTIPCVEYYQKFGRVRTIDIDADEHAEPKDDQAIMSEIKTLLLPQIMLLVGPTKSGKTTLGSIVATRTNIKLVKFKDFLKQKGLRGKDDETKVLELIKSLYYETAPRIMFEGFPENTF